MKVNCFVTLILHNTKAEGQVLQPALLSNTSKIFLQNQNQNQYNDNNTCK